MITENEKKKKEEENFEIIMYTGYIGKDTSSKMK